MELGDQICLFIKNEPKCKKTFCNQSYNLFILFEFLHHTLY